MKRWVRILSFSAAAVMAWPLQLWAATSTNYSVIEDNISNGSTLNSASANYRELGVDDGGSALGDTAVGNSSSANYQTGSGFNTAEAPGLMLVVNTASVNFGNVSIGTMATQLATFSVRNYTSYGYAVTLVGTAPTYSGNGHALSALATDTAYNATQEQFGINTVRSTVAAVGADPVQVPGGTFSYGVAGDGATGTYGTTRPYTISDKWRFVSGEVVASAPKSSGETDFTITFMMNAISTTPGGTYSGGLDLVVTGTY